MKKRILVIGSSGFIGSALCKKLVLEKHSVTGLDLHRISESELLTQFVEVDYLTYDNLAILIENADYIYHLSSSTIPAMSNLNPINDIETNLKGIILLLEILKYSPQKRLIFISSGGTVYGETKTHLIEESHETQPLCSYGIVKLTIEKYIQMYHRIHGVQYVIFRLSNPYGAKQLHGEGQGLIAKLILGIQKNEVVDIWGDGSIVRDYIYIDDVITAMTKTLNLNQSEILLNLSAGIGYSINQVISIIEGILNKSTKTNYHASRNFDTQHNILDIKEIKTRLKWEPKFDIKSGILKTIDDQLPINNYCEYLSG